MKDEFSWTKSIATLVFALPSLLAPLQMKWRILSESLIIMKSRALAARLMQTAKFIKGSGN